MYKLIKLGGGEKAEHQTLTKPTLKTSDYSIERVPSGLLSPVHNAPDYGDAKKEQGIIGKRSMKYAFKAL